MEPSNSHSCCGPSVHCARCDPGSHGSRSNTKPAPASSAPQEPSVEHPEEPSIKPTEGPSSLSLIEESAINSDPAIPHPDLSAPAPGAIIAPAAPSVVSPSEPCHPYSLQNPHTLDANDGRRTQNIPHLTTILTTYTSEHTLLLTLPTQQTSTHIIQDDDFEIPVEITDPITPGGEGLWLHHWDCTDPDVSWVCESGLHVDSAAYVRGWKELGSVVLRVGDGEDAHEALSGRVEEAESEDELIANLVKKLQTESEASTESGGSVRLQLYSVAIFSQEEGKSPFHGKEENVWCWVKEYSAYARKYGAWAKCIEDAVGDGEWTAGRNLRIMVRGISKQEKEEFFLGSKKKREVVDRLLRDFRERSTKPAEPAPLSEEILGEEFHVVPQASGERDPGLLENSDERHM